MYKDPGASDFDWNDLRSFLAVVRTGRLTTAANQLKIDHPTIAADFEDAETAMIGPVRFATAERFGAYSVTHHLHELFQEPQASRST